MDDTTRDQLVQHVQAITGHLHALWEWTATRPLDSPEVAQLDHYILTALTEPLTKLYTQFLWVNMWVIKMNPTTKGALVQAMAKALVVVHEALEALTWNESLTMDELRHISDVLDETLAIHEEGARVMEEAERIVRERNLREGRPEAPPAR